MKKVLALAILALFSVFTFGQAMRNPSFIHEYDDKLGIEKDLPEIILEERTNLIEENSDLKAEIVWYKEYNSATFIIVGSKIRGYDEGQFEKAFFQTIEKWIDETGDHRYYSYRVQNRKTFHSRKDKDGNAIVTMEFQVLLFK